MRDKEKIFSLLREAAESPRESDIVEELINKIERRMVPIEIIDDNHRKFNGMNFRKDKNGRYWSNFLLNRIVWMYYNGEIPEGYEIHHVDENKDNNDIANLVALTPAEHKKLHLKPCKFVCVACGKEFEAKTIGKNNRYCSKECRIKYRHNILHQEMATCKFCGKKFSVYKYNEKRRKKFCSTECFYEYSRQMNDCNVKYCAYCGNIIMNRQNKKYCSRECYAAAKRQEHLK